MNLKIPIPLFAVMVAFTISCKDQPVKQATSTQFADSMTIFASNIIYNVIIKNPDPGDSWTTECLKDLKKKELVDQIFEGIYNNQIEAFEIFTNKPLSASRIRKMEEIGEIQRETIGQLQFLEEWQFDNARVSMTKKVKEIRLGTEIFDDEGYLRGYEPLFKVVLN